MAKTDASDEVTYTGADGVRLVGERWKPGAGWHPRTGIALLLHGGGQTRHSWHSTAAGDGLRHREPGRELDNREVRKWVRHPRQLALPAPRSMTVPPCGLTPGRTSAHNCSIRLS
jgi:hypothetical protein